MNKLLLVSSLFLLSFFAKAQTSPPTTQWLKGINGNQISYNVTIKSVRDNVGNTYTLVWDQRDMKVLRYDNSGAVTQTYVYSHPYNGSDYPYDLIVDGSGNVYVSGRTFINYVWTPVIAKFNATGTLLWDHPIPCIFYMANYVESMAFDNNGNVFFTGVKNDSIQAGVITPAGTMLWNKTYTFAGYNVGFGKQIKTDNNGNGFICGQIKNTAGNMDFVAFKLNNSGVVQWNKFLVGAANGDDAATFINIDNSSNLYVFGNVADSSSTNYTPTLVKYNASGGQQWLKKLHTPLQFDALTKGMHSDALGNSYLLIQSMTALNVAYTKSYKINSLGTQIWTNSYDHPGAGFDVPSGIMADAFGNSYICGSHYNGVYDAYILKLNSSGVQSWNSSYVYDTYIPASSTLLLDNGNNVYVSLYSGYVVLLTKFSNAGAFIWEGPYTSIANPNDYGVEVLAQNNYSIYSLGHVLNDNTASDIVLSKYDNNGGILWQNMIDDNSYPNEAYDLEADAQFNISVLGSSASQGMLIKYDSIGSPLFAKFYVNQFKKMKTDASNNYYFVANGLTNTKDFVVAKADPNGNLIYTSTPTTYTTASTQVTSMAVDANNRIYAFGTMTATSPANKWKLRAQKFSPAGNLLWSYEVPNFDSTTLNNGTVYANKILVDNTNNVYLLATGNNTVNAQNFVQIIKLDNNGALLWKRDLDSTSWHEYGGDMVLSSANSIVVFDRGYGCIVRRIDRATGAIIWENSYLPQTQTGSYDMWANTMYETAAGDIYTAGSGFTIENLRSVHLIKWNSSGNKLWNYIYQAPTLGTGTNVASIAVTANGRVYMAGSTTLNSGDATDFFTMKLCDIAPSTISSIGATQNICPGNNVQLITTGGLTYSWNVPGNTASTYTADSTGAYWCTVYKDDGCFKNTDTIQVALKGMPDAPQICLVTVDSMSTHNIVIWDKTSIAGADSFKIFREDVTNVYTHIATVHADSLTEYHDLGANPNVTTKRYKMSAIDSCGNETAMSNYHNTLYIVDNGNGQYTWNPLYTIENTANPVNNYVLMRDDNSTNVWVQAAITAGTQSTLVDPNYALYLNSQYRVETIWNISCSPTRGVINTTRSNIKSASRVGINETISSASISLQPNPASTAVQISFSGNPADIQRIEMYDALGGIVNVSTNMIGNSQTFNIEGLRSGIYNIRIIGKNNIVIKRFVKQ